MSIRSLPICIEFTVDTANVLSMPVPSGMTQRHAAWIRSNAETPLQALQTPCHLQKLRGPECSAGSSRPSAFEECSGPHRHGGRSSQTCLSFLVGPSRAPSGSRVSSQQNFRLTLLNTRFRSSLYLSPSLSLPPSQALRFTSPASAGRISVGIGKARCGGNETALYKPKKRHFRAKEHCTKAGSSRSPTLQISSAMPAHC